MSKRGRGRPRKDENYNPSAPSPQEAGPVIDEYKGKYRAVHMVLDVGAKYTPGDIFEMSRNKARPLVDAGACVEVRE